MEKKKEAENSKKTPYIILHIFQRTKRQKRVQ